MQSQLFRQWRLLKMLAVRRLGVTLKEMAEETGVDEKTVRRDLDLFRDLGFPLTADAGEFNRKRWRIGADWCEPQKHFTFDEAIALLLGRRCLDPLAGTPFWLAANRAFDKICAALTDDVVRYIERMSDAFYQTAVGISDYAAKRDIIDALWIGVEDRRSVEITYHSRRAVEPTTYVVHPYGIVLHNHSLYLVGYSPSHQQIRQWKLDRVDAAELQRSSFPRPVQFDLAKHFADAFAVWDENGSPVTVQVRFLPPAVRYVSEKRWHATQKLTPQKDGSLLAEFRLSSTVEIKSWILSFGADAEILAPPQLRAEIRQELLSLLDRYNERAPPVTRPQHERRVATSTKQRLGAKRNEPNR